jgi:cellulose synthase/poly-beta-1,6-N-acetylglucosamine synthase-like glycosyltransferase
MTTLLWVWIGFTMLAFLVWMSRHLQIAAARRSMPPLRGDMYPAITGGLPMISLLVAAKDEEANIEGCLRTVLQQDYPDFEVIVIDDRSRDRTPQIIDALAAAHPRLTALHITELRPGWFGKNNAMREGVARARSEWLCFTDADCEFQSPRTLTVALRYAQEKQVDFLSVLPAHDAASFWERVVQPACSGILMIWFHPLRVNNPRRRTAYANGAFMLMRRSCYEAIGGHEPVKAEVNEDIHMAALAKRAGQRLHVISNEGLYTVRMYSTLRQIWSGWTRIFYGCFRSVRRLLLSALLVVVMSMAPYFALLVGGLMHFTTTASPAWSWLFFAGLAACVAQSSVTMRFYALNHCPAVYGLLYPIGAGVGLGALINAIRRAGGRGAITWRGTTYQGDRVLTK